MASARPRVSIALRAIVGLLFASSLYVLSGAIAARSPSHSRLDSSYSLLALGDTGKVHRPLAALLEGQIAVANDLEHEDRHHPVEAMLLLGDNFYMEGLKSSEMLPRLRRNIVLPYCRFMQLDGPRSAEVEPVCNVPPAMRHAIPIYAVLGNHDLVAPESPRLQREVIPQFITNWHMGSGFATTRELAPGLSLVLFSSAEYMLEEKKRLALISALKAAKGPWRILAAHIPMAIGEDGNVPRKDDLSLDFEEWVQSAIDEAGVAVQLYLSGHHHTLQVIEGGGHYGPALHVIAGGGARYREIEEAHPRRRYEASKLGFARIDLVGPPEARSLVVSIFRSPTIPLWRWGGPKLATRWSIGVEGTATEMGAVSVGD